ncbi:MAG TPA: right-handed parallel beta-helix repeat-containing protein [Burkholderiales bacterium]|nr:right-handed parallel beta-helix repeat-containing protein [Burkholderiales bacterium]
MNYKKLLFMAIFAMPLTSSLAATLYVDPNNSRATDSGAGEASKPYKSLEYATRQLAAGDTLILAPGIYRESIDLQQAPKLRGADEGKLTRIEAAPGAKVLIKGSDAVTGWERVEKGVFVKRNWSANSQQVFVDGVALKQIGGTILNGFPARPGHPMAKLHMSNGGIWPGRIPGGLDEMTDNSFFYDAKAQSLYVKIPEESLNSRLVEASVRPYLLTGQAVRNLRVSNLRFAHANTTSVSQAGAISLTGDNLFLDRIELTHVDGNGFDITGNDNTVSNSVANYCGQTGMKVRGKNARVLNNETSYNNTRGFNKWWEAGGAKFVGAGGLQDSEVAGHRAYFNNGDGIWFDWKNRNNKIHDNIAAYNTGMGIQYESSQSARIYNNYVFANKQRGIYLPNSSKSFVAHNLVVANGMEGIVIIDEARNNPERAPVENRVIGNIIAWNGKTAIVLPNDILDNVSDANLLVDMKRPTFSMGWGSRERPIVQGLTAWGAMSGQDKQSWHKDIAIPPQLAAELQARKLTPDWSALRELASELRIPSDRSFAESKRENRATPGPQS